MARSRQTFMGKVVRRNMVKYYAVERLETASGAQSIEHRCLSRQVALHVAGQLSRRWKHKGLKYIVLECWMDEAQEYTPKVIWEF